MLRVLPTGFGKSLVFHLLRDVFDFVECEGPPVKGKAMITVVIAPLNAHFLAVSNLRLVRVFRVFA